MFLVSQVTVNFGISISPSSKLYTNLVIHLYKYVNLVLLTNFVKFIWHFKRILW